MTSKIKKASVTVDFETSTGYESRAGSTKQPGNKALLWGLREIVRILTINGDEKEALAVFTEATEAVKKDLAEQIASKEKQ